MGYPKDPPKTSPALFVLWTQTRESQKSLLVYGLFLVHGNQCILAVASLAPVLLSTQGPRWRPKVDHTGERERTS